MTKVTIYQFKLYDISTDEKKLSRRWGTRKAIESIGGEVVEDSRVEVDAAVVVSGIDGMTEIGFNPHWRTGFQRQV